MLRCHVSVNTNTMGWVTFKFVLFLALLEVSFYYLPVTVMIFLHSKTNYHINFLKSIFDFATRLYFGCYNFLCSKSFSFLITRPNMIPSKFHVCYPSCQTGDLHQKCTFSTELYKTLQVKVEINLGGRRGRDYKY